MNFKSGTIFTGDNLHIMRGMDSESVDLIYLDPPFNSKANYAAPIGSPAEGAEFKDVWNLTDIDVQWLDSIQEGMPPLWYMLKSVAGLHSPSMLSYLVYMIPRLNEMKRLLKPTGSIYLHCDPTASHYLKLVMDYIFGKKNFRNEIVWAYTGPGSPKMRQFNRKHDLIFWYASGNVWTFNADAVRLPYDAATVDRGKYESNSSSVGEGYRDVERGKVPESWWRDIGSGGQMSKKERVGYPTQKPLKLLDRIIKASSNPGDMVLDPFCGCATACIAARRLDRKWVGIDILEKAAELVDMRIAQDEPLFEGKIRDKCIRRSDIPVRSVEAVSKKAAKEVLYGSQKGYCGGCSRHFEVQNFHVDHIIPKSHGGQDILENYQLLCGHCNSVKGTKTMEHLKARLEELGISQ